ncbi:RNB domain-containing ribonuclease [Desulfosarcina sp. OttesenSCG-928-A07]|nr:RNB domain-containing ribonuclease [Desulfosarcina sp. OttesenSCG-928-G17]MDL2329243.1 RNB domain-containing ribonuclease [Desulfosarcina sp. OttesenSCG-928-A07]
MESGDIVEYIDDRKIICAVVTQAETSRLRLFTEQCEDVFMTSQRLSHQSTQKLSPGLDRANMAGHLSEISEKRDAIAGQINIEELWEVVSDAPEWIDLKTMTGLCFPENPDADHESAVIRAMFRSRRHFRFRPDRFLPHTPDEMAAIRKQQNKAEYEASLISTGVAWLQSVREGKAESPPVHSRALTALFKSCYLYDRESPHYEIGRAILKAGDFTATNVFFDHLVAIGKWDADENVDLLRYHVPVDFSPQMNALAQVAAEAADPFSEKGRVDLTHLSAFTIDGQSTLDFDDALTIEFREDHFLVGIHISDVASLIKKGDPLDREALIRGSSIYMPDTRISMIPPILAENRLSLKKGEIRPTISTMVKVRRNGEIISYDIFPSVIRVAHQLSYFEANMSSEAGDAISRLYEIALRFREKRLAQGALQIVLPEVTVWLDAPGTPAITRVNRESPGRLLIAEMMILSNWLSARFLAGKNIPAIFRSQPKPKARILKNGDNSVFQNWMQRKLLNRFALRSSPETHCGLGLDAYLTATSPIRKYFDLATQRQLRAAFDLESPYSRQEIETLIDHLTPPMANVGRIQFRRNRYWLLKHLETRVGEREEAIVLQRRRNAYMVLLKAYMLECSIPQPSGIALQPEDVVQVTIQYVNPRDDTIFVFMG